MKNENKSHFENNKFVWRQILFCVFFAPFSLILFDLLNSLITGSALGGTNFLWALIIIFTIGLPITIGIMFAATLIVIWLSKLKIWKFILVVFFLLIGCFMSKDYFDLSPFNNKGTFIENIISPNSAWYDEYPIMIIIIMLFAVSTYLIIKSSRKTY